MTSAMSGNIFNIQRFSVQDGPGIRTTLFMKGCPLACPWCSNPESQANEIELGYRDSLCDDCGRCKDKCKVGAISILEKGISIDRDKCNSCLDCLAVCAPTALKVLGESISADRAIAIILKDAKFYQNSNGGVTCSGGEPLMQSEFVAEVFKRCKAAGIHTTIDTTGHASKSALERVLPFTDLVLFDVKLIDNEKHKKVVKFPNTRILQNLKRIKSEGISLIIRVPLIPGLTDSEENIDGIAQFVTEELGGAPINVLPYHRFGTNKYSMLDIPYELDGLAPLAEEQVAAIVNRFESFGLSCEVVV
ncbi:MAG: glycyl-radical enzyme activating protein [Halieaceae bacterium]|nr:glycyl-radical enzyme activating protein [Halieaceae bacterium]